METGSGREMGAFSASGKDIPVVLAPLQLCFPRRGQVLLPVSEPRDGRKETEDASSSVCLRGNALDRASLCLGPAGCMCYFFPRN